ncbi:MAG: OsmC family protein [Candidatus Bathyarchaeota archaeon]|nr:OsmC family protein [Candidatus Bathyarchaeota archaeon]
MSEPALTTLKLLHGYRFKAEFDVASIPDIVVDELSPIGESAGPNPTRLMSVAVGQCLSSSLLYCLQRAKIKVKDLQTTIKANVGKDEEGYLRIISFDVRIQLDVNEEDKIRVPRCREIFEKYCTVTQSVRKGINVNVEFV